MADQSPGDRDTTVAVAHTSAPAADTEEAHDTALVVAHEIFGVNDHITVVADALRRYRCDVFTPDFRPVPKAFGRAEEPAAYEDFMRNLGVEPMGRALARYAAELRPRYRRVLGVGYSVGATATWLAAGTGALDRTVCFYGSRIRDHLDVQPHGGCLLVIAEHEVSFSGAEFAARVAGRPGVTAELHACEHGFCDPDSPHHSPEHSAAAWRSAVDFLGLSGGR
ncbi:dienelactone hydrolase family protein [Streptomyces sp. cmx-18-6]|uniref:dienelactone hydrolase family protein n=1 Tax=Streptomyces sp. cmx-18-6 TaxID=2790930 RepID=UPI00397FF41D